MGTRRRDRLSTVFGQWTKLRESKIPLQRSGKNQGWACPFQTVLWRGSTASLASVPPQGPLWSLAALMTALVPTPENTVHSLIPWVKQQEKAATLKDSVHPQGAPWEACKVAASPAHLAFHPQGNGGRPRWGVRKGESLA